MLLTLTTSSLQHYRRDRKPLDVMDIPEFVAEELGLRGLSLNASLLKGMSIVQVERLRDRADRVHCPILVLVEDEAHDFSSEATLAGVQDRLVKLGMAASKLGCPGLAVRCSNVVAETLEHSAANIKRTLARLERYEVHLLLRPGEGLTADPAQMAALIKRIGGFRIGSLPSFAAAAKTGDALGALRQLTPYAQALEATVKGFGRTGKHEGWELDKCIEVVRSVGYQNTIGIDYVGKADPLGAITKARDILQQAIAAEDPA